MPRSSNQFSWMGSNTHHIQARCLSGLNPDGCHQLASQSTQEREITPFEFNTYNHKVHGEKFEFDFKLIIHLRNIVINMSHTCPLNRSLSSVRMSGRRRPSLISSGMTSCRQQPGLVFILFVDWGLSLILGLSSSGAWRWGRQRETVRRVRSWTGPWNMLGW